MAYRKVDQKLWTSGTFRSMSEDARTLYQYLLTSPHNNALCCFVLRPLYAADDLQWEPKRVMKAMDEVTSTRRPDGSPMVLHDPATDLVAVYGQLEKDGIINGNCASACIKVLEGLPSQSPVYAEILRQCEMIDARAKQPFMESLIELLRQSLPESLGESFEEPLGKQPSPFPSPSPVPEPEPESSSNSCSAPAKPASEPAVLKIPLIKSHGEFKITQAKVDEWQSTFPGIDVMQELRTCRQWNIDNPSRRKTRNGIKAHISSWLGRAQNRSRGSAGDNSNTVFDRFIAGGAG